ncbi:TIGR03915 family putative DNA repair protein [Cellulophaga baltica]|uniref:TIGR03915 family putative DNA repair protein n=1 Tax=Cellulophaga TaxID=104264 RepID=UPI001C06BA13|nr:MULTISPECIES: TIGR03915 family putative DNA repair protein [Cellulophaga]MBU2996392.1 TIGR03915 family putative DNA repair protein [Cellulophaga baltica]MDO6767788.1 TIGR03915 family putative DNA repair protein [Cellulophaga sp. 1_MG-2023]
MNEAKNLIYDGSFNGFLTAVFVAFEEKIEVSNIQNESIAQQGLFSDSEKIYTDDDKAKRVWNGIQKKSKQASSSLYFAFLSETDGIELLAYYYIQKLFSYKQKVHLNYADDIVLKINQIAKSVGREKHRMEAFVRFQLTKDSIYFANIEPDFNVLPLISKHFKDRYADQQWIIYDLKRKYGLFYNLESVEIIALDLDIAHTNSIYKSSAFTTEEHDFQQLWNDYFKSTNIKSRINLKLHTQHVPKRYWKYLSEKKAM